LLMGVGLLVGNCVVDANNTVCCVRWFARGVT
jgi:hypothetical protein